MRLSNNAEWANFDYDDASRLLTARNGTVAWNTNIISTVTRTYDAAGRLTLDQQAVTNLAAKNVNYEYNDDGKQRHLYVTGANYDYTFSYDAMGRFEKISPTGGSTAFQYHYDAASNETERTRILNNVKEIYGPDSLNRMSRLDLKRNTTPLSAEVYEYDRMSRLTVANRWPENKQDLFGYYWDGDMMWAQYGVSGPEMPEGGDPDQDMPDTTDPWAGWAGAGEAEGIEPPPFQEEGEPDSPVVEEPDVPMERWVSYFLDNAGNRTRVVDTGVHKLYSPNNLNQYYQAEGIGVGNGGQHEVNSFQNVTYTYRNDERLIRVTSGTNAYDLAYDALGRCVKRRANNGTWTYYIYDGEKPILEYSAGAIVARNVYGKWIDEILMRTDTTVNGGQPFYYQQDRNHNVTHLTNAAGTVIEKYKYDAFGAPTFYDGNGNGINYSTFKNRFLFTGREYAAATATGYNAGFKFYEYRARAYNPVLGRFMSEDPKGFDAGDYNLFRYCHNDPLDLTDPMGLEGGLQPQPGDHDPPSPAVRQNKQNEPARRPDGSGTPNAEQVDQRAKDTASVKFSPDSGKANVAIQSPEDIKRLGGPDGAAVTKIFEPNGIVTTSNLNAFGKIDVTQTVTATTLLATGSKMPGSDGKVDPASRLGLELKVVEKYREAAGKADSAAKALARQGFKDRPSAERAVHDSTRGFLKTATDYMRANWDMFHGRDPGY